MADIPVPGYQAFWWAKARKTTKAEFELLVGQNPDAEVQLTQLFKLLCDIKDVAGYTPALVGERQEWTSIVITVDVNRTNFYKALSRETPCSALYGTYTLTLSELKGLLKVSLSEKN
jgi:hypothetical protein